MTEWRHNSTPSDPGYYWVMHDHWMDEEPYVIRVFVDNDGELSWFATNCDGPRKLRACQDFNYWRDLPVPVPPAGPVQ